MLLLWESVSGETEEWRIVRRNTELFSCKIKAIRELGYKTEEQWCPSTVDLVVHHPDSLLQDRGTHSPNFKNVCWWLTNEFFFGNCPQLKGAISSKVTLPAGAAHIQWLVKTSVYSLVPCPIQDISKWPLQLPRSPQDLCSNSIAFQCLSLLGPVSLILLQV